MKTARRRREPAHKSEGELCYSTLRLLLPDNKVVAIPLLDRDATSLRINLEGDPAFSLTNGDFELKLKAVCFRPGEPPNA